MGHVKVSCIIMDELAGGGRRGRFQGSTLANGLCAGKAQPGRETGRGCTARSMLPCAWPDGGAPSVSADTLLGDGESPRTMRTDLRSSGPRVKRTPRPRSSESGLKIGTTELFGCVVEAGFSFSVCVSAARAPEHTLVSVSCHDPLRSRSPRMWTQECPRWSLPHT